ncbi:hypothetical protein BLX87_00865 [Bacillus sp. VT-16-64]|nr:hypothetical protein BLX87_00865 [Bacillus sp. VT-16-64]
MKLIHNISFYMNLLFQIIYRSIIMLLVILIIVYYFSGDLLISMLTILIITFYIFVHEMGHILFLQKFQISFLYRVKHLAFYPACKVP